MADPVVRLQDQRGMQLVRFVTSLAATRGDLMGAVPFAEAKGWSSTAGVLKALVAPLGQGDVASALWPITVDLSEVLRPLTVIGRLQGMRRVPFATRVLAQTAGGVGTWISEGQPIAVKADAFAVGSAMFATKCAGINVVTTELLLNATPASYPIIANDLVSGVAQALDVAFVDPSNAGDAATPASITHGATSFESTGSTVAAVDYDLGRLLGALTDANCSLATAAWIMSPRTASSLARLRGSGGGPAYPLITARGGSLLGQPVITSGNVKASGSPGETLIALVEADEVLLADEGQGDIELSNEAALQLSDGPSTGAQAQVSLWQMGLVGVKTTRTVNWTIRRATSAAVLRSVLY